jgi:DNA-binding NtrC family response regulator
MEKMMEKGMERRGLERVLVVDDCPRLQRSLCAALADSYPDVRACGSVAEADAVLAAWWPDLVLLDIVLPDGDALQVVERLARQLPAPVVVAMTGAAGPAQAFELAAHGVQGFLDKPLDLARVHAAIERALTATPAIAPALRLTVGHRSLAEVETEVRAVMIDEALARAGGSRRGAARLLEMSRQLLQHALRRGR